MFVWALAIRYNPIQPDYIIAVTMVLPFLVNILPMLVLGVRLPPGYLRLSWTHFNRAPFKLVIPGALMNSAAIFSWSCLIHITQLVCYSLVAQFVLVQ